MNAVFRNRGFFFLNAIFLRDGRLGIFRRSVLRLFFRGGCLRRGRIGKEAEGFGVYGVVIPGSSEKKILFRTDHKTI